MNYFKKILLFAKPYKVFAVLNIISNIFYAIFSTLAMVSLFPMLKVLFQNTEPVDVEPEWSGMANAREFLENYLNFYVTQNIDQGPDVVLLYMVLLVISMFLLKNLFNYLAMFFITFLRNGVLRDLRDALYKKCLQLPIAYFSDQRKGDTISRITTDVLEIQNSFLSILVILVRDPLTIVFTIVTMVLISWELSIFVFIFIPISGFMISLIGKSLKKKSDRVQKEQGFFLSILEETLSGLKIIKSFNAKDQFNDRFQASTQRYYDFSNKLLNRQNLASPMSEFLGITVIAALLWYGGRMVLIDDTLNAGLFITYMGLSYQILTPAKSISKASYSIKKGNAAAARVLEILEKENDIKDDANSQIKTDFKDRLSLANIWFKYQDEWVLKDFSVDIKKGKTIALVGPSGSGKSTVTNLITRFYDVQKGDISIDGLNVKNIKLESIQNLIALVTQDSILFNDSIRQNLKVADENATDDQLIEALKIANAYRFVNNLPKGLDTHVGDSGNKLSGGQKQRISIARAVLKNAPILVLDEATSSLDTESERLVQEALERIMNQKTSLVIAHRLSTIKNADEILVLDNGEIKERGSHQQLLNKDHIYKKLVEMQSFE
ncbi:MAG: ABC transporter ATP-binding protein [Psychroflexus sp.]|nr:ABC transporter ATP-binding protein [Psychroflexus sp.]MDR9448826.1 ABC transporter ATP-binding protein [Psychroflexus sp.]